MHTEIKITRAKIKGKYRQTRITIPKMVLAAIPRFKTARKAELDIDVLGNLVVKPK